MTSQESTGGVVQVAVRAALIGLIGAVLGSLGLRGAIASGDTGVLIAAIPQVLLATAIVTAWFAASFFAAEPDAVSVRASSQKTELQTSASTWKEHEPSQPLHAA